MTAQTPSLRQQVRAQKISSVYKHTWTLSISHPIAGALLVAYFWEVAAPVPLLLWLATLIAVSVSRVPLYFRYRKHERDIAQCGRWGLYFAAMSALQGALYGFAWFAFVPSGDQFYLSVVCLWAMGLSSCAVVGYAAHPKTLLAFFIPVVLPGVLLLIMDGSDRMQILAAALFLYGVVILLASAPVYRSIVRSIELNIRLKELSEKDGLEQITVSIGGTTVEGDYPANPESLIENADTALYMAKNHGRNQYYFYCRRSGQLAAEAPLTVAVD